MIVSGAWIVRRSRNVSLNLDCRNETIPILRALQHIYSTPKVRDSILGAIARDVNGKSKATLGRPGLSYWEILVLAAARLGCGYDYDQLQDLAENHRALRQVMGIGDWESAEKDQKRFDWRRIESNVNLLRPETIEQINQAIIQEGHRLEPQAAETVRGDSFVVQTNIHYPTDSSLIADGLRKVLGLAVMLAGLFGLIGWRQHKHLYRKARKLVRTIERIAARKGSGYQERMKQPYRELLEVADQVLTRAETLRETVRKYGTGGGAEALALDKDLETFLQRTRHVCNLARRRVLQGETIPHHEKLFSIFETHTQLYKRGKAAEPIQFGRLVLVFEDGAGFITHHHLLPRDKGDRDVVVEPDAHGPETPPGQDPPRVVRPRLSQPAGPGRVGQDPRTSLCADAGEQASGPAGKDGQRRVPQREAVASGYRIGDRRVAVGQRTETLPRPDGEGI